MGLEFSTSEIENTFEAMGVRALVLVAFVFEFAGFMLVETVLSVAAVGEEGALE